MVMEHAKPEASIWGKISHQASSLAHNLYKMQAKIVRQNLHPGNVAFVSETDMLLIDVGLSWTVSLRRKDDGIYGHPAYLPPEVFDGQPYVMASDVYCLARCCKFSHEK